LVLRRFSKLLAARERVRLAAPLVFEALRLNKAGLLDRLRNF
jgi:hypothetical protein